MNTILPINKPLGITSYDVIRKLKKLYPGEVIGHAGTLDPLANGVLVCLVGKEATKRQSEFMDVDKEYEFEVLFGFETDTYDILGLVTNAVDYDASVALEQAQMEIPKMQGLRNQPVPPFSAVKIKGRPLYRWYLDGKIKQVEIPVKEINIEHVNILESKFLSKDEVQSKIFTLLQTVDAGFRKDQVISKWNDVFAQSKTENFLTVKMRAVVSKGTYVRAIANELGRMLGCGAITLTITRNRVGQYQISESFGLEEIQQKHNL